MIVTGLRKIESWVVAVAIVANVSGALVLLALVAIMNVDVISRNLFHAPFRGVVEVVVFSLALIVFLQLPIIYIFFLNLSSIEEARIRGTRYC